MSATRPTGTAALLAPLRSLRTLQPSDRPWELAFACMIAAGVPLLAGSAAGLVGEGLAGSLGAMALLYLPRTPLLHRLRIVAIFGLAMIACYAAGLWLAGRGVLAIAGLGLLASAATALCRSLQRSPPGSLFLVMPAAIAAAAGPLAPARALSQLAALATGCLFAVAVAAIYSIYIGRRRARLPVQPLGERWSAIWRDAAVHGMMVAVALVLAAVLGLSRPYWVAISTVTIMSGASVAHAWQRKIHRVTGTGAGLILAVPLLSVIHVPWQAAIAIMALLFAVEMLVVRHYALAVAFITPMAILLAETPQLSVGEGATNVPALLLARLVDTLLGAAIGVAGVALQGTLARRAARH
ncbi:FUSC family protein [Croceibacterium mercuriale]|uniref:FUSC family protein n=1 Tax=Croceibacterium mercuriale TaxID=1572751 RepID=UPI00068FCBE6|nr:FUSC family protein [Croceibacterium mercuriale]